MTLQSWTQFEKYRFEVSFHYTILNSLRFIALSNIIALSV